MPAHGVVFSVVVSLLLGLGAAGCETRTVATQTHKTVRQPVATVVIGDIRPLYPEWKRLVRFYKEGLAQKLRESEAFDSVLHPAPVVLPPDAVVVEGVLDGVDEGSELMRILIANNASRATVQGQFRFVDGSDTILAEFRQERVSNGDTVKDEQIYMEDLVGQLGRDTAAIMIRWSRGHELEPDRAVVEWWGETVGTAD